jgi:oligoribonuclease
MTGLDLVNDALIEVSVHITDGELNLLDEGLDVVIRPEPAAVEQMNRADQ